MADLGLVQVRTLVDETDIGKIQTGQRATVTVDAYPNRPIKFIVPLAPGGAIDFIARQVGEVLTRMLTRDGDINVVATAVDPIDARNKIKALSPDVVTLDIEMPNMNGLAFLDKLMRLHPLPVVMVSTLTTKGASETLLALELGAVDFVAKPSHDGRGRTPMPPCRRRECCAASGPPTRPPGSRSCCRSRWSW